MIKRILPIAVLGAALISNTGCGGGNSGFKKAQGLEYKIIKEGKGKKAIIGDVMQYNILAKCDTTELANSYKLGSPGMGNVEEPKKGGDPLAPMYTILSVGDSAIVQISCDTLLAAIPKEQTQLPPWLKKGKKIIVNMTVVSIKTRQEIQDEMKAKADAQVAADDKMLQDYFAKNNLKPTKTASGLYYSITKEGTGETAKPGKMVTMKYIGKTLEGKQFDANVDENFQPLPGKQPFTFPLGQGRVIRGWDEGVALLKKGSKASLYIPSLLAYGPRGAGADIAPNACLVFNVEVEEIADIPGGEQGGPQGMPQRAPQGAPQQAQGQAPAPQKIKAQKMPAQQAPPKTETK